MNILILGKGNMGAPLAALVSEAGHDVTSLSSRDDVLPALASAEIVILALKYEQALELVCRPDVCTALKDRIVVDMTNPLAADYMSLTIGHSTSAAEEIASRLPGVSVVKAFNTIFAGLLARRAAGAVVAVPVFVASDQAAARDAVMAFVGTLGLEAIDAGPLSNSRHLEPMAEFMIQLGYGLGHGAEIGFGLVRAGGPA